MEKDWMTLRHLMVERQLMKRGIDDQRVLNAFLQVPRHLFAPKEFSNEAYQDYPLGIGFGQTISQPYIVALMVQSLNLSKDDSVLEIGTGSGYQTAILSTLVTKVCTIERIPALLETAKERLTTLRFTNILFGCWDGNEGWAKEAPYEAIIISAATNTIPSILIQQLKIGGRMIVPLGTHLFQRLTLLVKKENNCEIKSLCGCQFVPLVSGLFIP